MSYNRSPVWVVCLAIFVAGCGVIGAVHHVKLALTATDTASAMTALMPGLMYLMTGFGLAVIMLNRPAAVDVTTKPKRSDNAVNERLVEAIDRLTEAADRMQSHQPHAVTAATASTSDEAPAAAMTDDSGQRIVALLEEIRELSMMSDAQRASVFQHHAQRRRTLLLRQAVNHIGASQFAEAEKLIEQVTGSYTQGVNVNDNALEQAKRQLADARAKAVADAVDNVRAQVEDLMALSRWDEAIDVANRLADNYPGSSEAQQLRDRVARERDIFRTAACQRLYDEIKTHVDHRDWRRALAGTQTLLQKFGDLPRAERVRSTLRTIQDNAEIQERQELEARIQELIRGHRFSDAIDLSEELIARFPGSPQADKLRELLPKLREHSIKHEAGDLVEQS